MANEASTAEYGSRVLERLRRQFALAHEDDDDAVARLDRLYLTDSDDLSCCGEDETDQTKYHFWWPFRAIVDEIESTLLDHGLRPSGNKLYISIDPAPGDTTQVVVHDPDSVFVMYSCKPWNFRFVDEQEFALFLGEVCQAIFRKFEAR